MPFQPRASLTPEQQSRLMLWNAAFQQTAMLLKQAQRAQAALSSEEVQTKDKRHIESAQAFVRTQPDYTLGLQRLSHYVKHDALHPREFADSLDCYAMSDACRMLAVVFFCQIFKSGCAEDGHVAGNSNDFVAVHLERIVSIACFTHDERQSLKALRQQLESARDKMLAHADASSFDVRSFEAGTTLKLHTTAISGIDFSALALVANRLQQALRSYMFPMTT